MVHRVLPDLKELPDFLDHKVRKVFREYRACKEQQVLQR
jgi:hypothetical protein